jgi:AcrR family transcriptional regulator
MAAAPPTRDRILDAVMKLIRDGGVHAVTLSAVCRLAKLSKGGLVHHFPSKDALIDAFLDRAAGQYMEYMDTKLARVPKDHGQWTCAWLDLFLRNPKASGPQTSGREERSDLGDEQCTAVMLALIQSSGRAGMAKDLFDQVFRNMRADGVSLDLATTLLVTLDGFWFQSVIEEAAEVQARATRLRRQLQKSVRTEMLGNPKRKSKR